MPPVRRLTAIFAADVAGYSRLMGADEEGTPTAQGHLRELIDPKIAEHRGRVVKNTGDGFLPNLPASSTRCDARWRCSGGWPSASESRRSGRIEFRIGINLGDMIVEERDIFGDGVNVAARLEALAEPGGICVSRVVHDQVRDRLRLPRGYGRAAGQEHRPAGAGLPGSRAAATTRNLSPPRRRLPLPDKPSIAVLPFTEYERRPGAGIFRGRHGRGDHHRALPHPWLFVIARNSSFTYKGQPSM